MDAVVHATPEGGIGITLGDTSEAAKDFEQAVECSTVEEVVSTVKSRYKKLGGVDVNAVWSYMEDGNAGRILRELGEEGISVSVYID